MTKAPHIRKVPPCQQNRFSFHMITLYFSQTFKFDPSCQLTFFKQCSKIIHLNLFLLSLFLISSLSSYSHLYDLFFTLLSSSSFFLFSSLSFHSSKPSVQHKNMQLLFLKSYIYIYIYIYI
jgi:hypothetical protein